MEQENHEVIFYRILCCLSVNIFCGISNVLDLFAQVLLVVADVTASCQILLQNKHNNVFLIYFVFSFPSHFEDTSA